MDFDAEKEKLEKLLKIGEKRAEAAEIQAAMSRPDFWSDQNRATGQSKRLSQLEQIVSDFETVATQEDIERLQKQALLNGKWDESNAIVSVHAGAGGTEAQDWAGMLLEMFIKYAEGRGYDAQVLEKSTGEEAGIKSATVKIDGLYAFGYLKAEAGVHRLVRISPFDADKARHTSFALVEVIPEIENIELEIDEKELRIDVYRSSGKGGQSVNTTDSAVRITHLPSKIVVAVQNERSQMQNKATAMKILKAKLIKRQTEEGEAERLKLRGEHKSAEWGNQIRSYVFMPYQLVKDHRTGYEETNPQKVLGGEIQGFIEKYLEWSNETIGKE